jgi:hypothetical protein
MLGEKSLRIGENMADKGMTLAIVLLVAGLIVGGGIGYFASPLPTSMPIGNDKNLPVHPVYTTELPSNMSGVTSYSLGDYVIYVWEGTTGLNPTVYWTYAKVGG